MRWGWGGICKGSGGILILCGVLKTKCESEDSPLQRKRQEKVKRTGLKTRRYNGRTFAGDELKYIAVGLLVVTLGIGGLGIMVVPDFSVGAARVGPTGSAPTTAVSSVTFKDI